MINPKVEKFLEENNLTFMFCLLANKEVARLSNVYEHIKKNMGKTITEEALDHIATNNIPDYMFEQNDDLVEERKNEELTNRDLMSSFDDDDDDE